MTGSVIPVSARADYIKREEVNLVLPLRTVLRGSGKPINFLITEEEVEATITLAQAKSLYYALFRCLKDIGELKH